ncbi:MAG: peptide deformylase, partial [Vicinamibacterales bacterium]
MIRPLLRHGAPVLHRPAEPVSAVTPEIQTVIDDMVQTMYAAPGIGLAAPQIGVPLRIFVVDVTAGRSSGELVVMVNPEFVEREGMQ